MPYLIDFSLIQKTMDEKKISARKLAKMLGISVSSVSSKA